jgi:hypothetical protein
MLELGAFQRMNPVYYCGWRFFRTAYKLYCRAEWFNAERVPKSGPVILASNHASIIDPPLVGTGLERGISYLARESLFRFPASVGSCATGTPCRWTAMAAVRVGLKPSWIVCWRAGESFCFLKARGRWMESFNQRVQVLV